MTNSKNLLLVAVALAAVSCASAICTDPQRSGLTADCYTYCAQYSKPADICVRVVEDICKNVVTTTDFYTGVYNTYQATVLNAVTSNIYLVGAVASGSATTSATSTLPDAGTSTTANFVANAVTTPYSATSTTSASGSAAAGQAAPPQCAAAIVALSNCPNSCASVMPLRRKMLSAPRPAPTPVPRTPAPTPAPRPTPVPSNPPRCGCTNSNWGPQYTCLPPV